MHMYTCIHYTCIHVHTHMYTQMSKLLLVGMAEPPIDQASFYTSLAVVGRALKYLPTSHTSEPDLHERAIGLQMTAALQLLPHTTIIRNVQYNSELYVHKPIT